MRDSSVSIDVHSSTRPPPGRQWWKTGYAPSVRLFEAANCGTPVLPEAWREIVVATSTSEAVGALDLTDRELTTIAAAARERALAMHTCDARASELVEACSAALSFSQCSAASYGSLS